MNNLFPHLFFSLQDIPFRDLFIAEDFVWQALKSLEEYMSGKALGKIEVTIPSTAYLENASQISIGHDSIVEPGAYIKGPCFLGKNCVVRHGAYIRGFVLAGDGCVIGHDTEIKNSILLKDVHAAHFAYIGDSILGSGVNLGAGVKCANYRLDEKEVPVFYEGKKMETGLRKLGAIIGDRSQIGCNSVLNPGTLLGKNTLCHPLTSVHGFIPANSVLKSSAKLEIL